MVVPLTINVETDTLARTLHHGCDDRVWN